MKDKLLNEITHEIEHSDLEQLKHSISHFKQCYLAPMRLDNNCFMTHCETCECRCSCTILIIVYFMLQNENKRRNKVKYKPLKEGIDEIKHCLTDSNSVQLSTAYEYFDNLLLNHTPTGIKCWGKPCSECVYKTTCNILINILALIRSFQKEKLQK